MLCLWTLAVAASSKSVLQKPTREATRELFKKKGIYACSAQWKGLFSTSSEACCDISVLNSFQTFGYAADVLLSLFLQPGREKPLPAELFLCWRQLSTPSRRSAWPSTTTKTRHTVGFLLCCAVTYFKKYNRLLHTTDSERIGCTLSAKVSKRERTKFPIS